MTIYTCAECGIETKGHSNFCRSCSVKLSWKDDEDRKNKLSQRFINDNPGTGRPKGSKNRNPYPKGVTRNVSENHGSWNRNPKKIASQVNTWAEKSSDEIDVMLEKQIKTKIENGTMIDTRYYQGKFKPKNPEKYKGNIDAIVYRSSWELAVLKWLDNNNSVIKYSSEEVVIPYFYEVDKKMHRYFVDFLITFDTGKTFIVEVKPHKETEPPKRPDKSKRYISEAMTYVKNQNKWNAAEKYAKDNGYTFMIWTEKELTKMGILPKQSEKQLKPLKPLKPFRKKKKK